MHAFCSFPEKEEMEDGVGDLFDHIEDLLDFPGDDDVLGMVEPCGDEIGGPLMIPQLPESIASELLGCGGGGGGKDSLEGFVDQNQKSVDEKISTEEDKQSPCDELDVVQLEWMSKFLEDSDSFSLCLPRGSEAVDKSVNSGDSHALKVNELFFFRTSSPVSVLEAIANAAGGQGCSNSSSSFSSSTSTSTSTSESYFIGSTREAKAPLLSPSPPEQPTPPFVPARARSKRPRPAAFTPRPHVIPCNLAPSSMAVPVPDQVSSCAATSDPESSGESFTGLPPLKNKPKKKNSASNGDKTVYPPLVRKCTHCEIQKTPQWRAGPLGPKTLCNACGVRYKSGRLFPEYRPAASPTFVPTIHSNSHKKVIEMRIKATQKSAGAGTTVRSSDSCDLLAYIRRRE